MHLAQCGFLGQAYLAGTAMTNYLDSEHYLKILCTADDRQEARIAPKLSGNLLADAF